MFIASFVLLKLSSQLISLQTSTLVIPNQVVFSWVKKKKYPVIDTSPHFRPSPPRACREPGRHCVPAVGACVSTASFPPLPPSRAQLTPGGADGTQVKKVNLFFLKGDKESRPSGWK